MSFTKFTAWFKERILMKYTCENQFYLRFQRSNSTLPVLI